MTLDRESYRRDPGRASALAYWKARELDGPAGPVVLHASADDGRYGGAPRRYLNLVRDLAQVRPVVAPHGITLRPVSPAAAHEISALIAACYDDIRATPDEVRSWGSRSVHDPGLWVGAFQDEDLVGCAIADSDPEIEELSLDWVQVHPAWQSRGIGRALVTEVLRRGAERAAFATVSGDADSEAAPERLYRACGFTGDDVWHVYGRT